METVVTLMPQLGWLGVVAALASITFGIFVFLEQISSKGARDDLAKYLLASDLRIGSIQLHRGPQILFERVFGSRHSSLRCVVTSIAVSICGIAVLVCFSALHSPSTRSTFLDEKEFYILGVWAGWSIVPDYFSLLKTRIILLALVKHRVSSLLFVIAILCTDFVVGLAVFGIGAVVWNFTIALTDFGKGLDLSLLPLIFYESSEQFLYSLSLVLNFKFPLANFFWAGMLPSVWLWLYLAAALLTGLATRSAPILRFLIWFLDIREHPFRSVGVVAAILVSGSYAVYVVASGLIG